MHISEGVLSASVLATGGVLALIGTTIGLKKMRYEQMPIVALLTSAFFVASLIHIKIGGTSAHLVLNGLLGILLGWSVFPAILVALTLQAILFQFGGLTTLGVNTFNMALPAILSFFIFTIFHMLNKPLFTILGGILAGIIGIIGSITLVAISLLTTDPAFLYNVKIMISTHIPVIIIEGIVSGFIVGFLNITKPDLLRSKNKEPNP